MESNIVQSSCWLFWGLGIVITVLIPLATDHPSPAVAGTAGLAVLRYLQKNDLVTASAAKGKVLGERLSGALGELPCVGDVRGIGLLWGVEFVADRATKASFPPAAHFARRVADAAFDKGLIIYPGAGCADGVAGDLVLVAPPFIITEARMDEVVRLLREAVLEVSGSLI